MRSRATRVVAALSAFMLVVLLSACASDDDGETAPKATEEASGSAENVAQVCDADTKINTGLNEIVSTVPALQTDEFQAEEVAKALPEIQAGYDKNVAPAVEDLVEAAPAEIRSEINDMAARLKKFREEGDTSVLSGESGEKANAYYYENCPGEKGDIKGTEYAFNGSTDFKAGQVRVRFTNEGKELHHMVIFTKNPGVTESFEELFDLPEEQGAEKFHPVGGLDPIAPGDSGYIAAEFAPGEYTMVCFIAQGSTPEKVGAGTPPFSDEVPPHLALGMKKDFTISES